MGGVISVLRIFSKRQCFWRVLYLSKEVKMLLFSLACWLVCMDFSYAQENKKRVSISDAEVVALGKEALKISQEMFSRNSSWTLVRNDELSGIKAFKLTHTSRDGRTKNAFACQWESPTVKPFAFFKEWVINMPSTSKYNPATPLTPLIKKINTNTRVYYNLLKTETPFQLPPRELVYVQYSGLMPFYNGTAFMIGYQSMDYYHPKRPVNNDPKVIPATIYPSGIVMENYGTGSRVTWLENLDPKYDVPQAAIDVYTPFNMILYAEAIKKHVEAN